MDLVKEELENSLKGDEKKEESGSDDEDNHKGDPTPHPIGSLMKGQ